MGGRELALCCTTLRTFHPSLPSLFFSSLLLFFLLSGQNWIDGSLSRSTGSSDAGTSQGWIKERGRKNVVSQSVSHDGTCSALLLFCSPPLLQRIKYLSSPKGQEYEEETSTMTEKDNKSMFRATECQKSPPNETRNKTPRARPCPPSKAPKSFFFFSFVSKRPAATRLFLSWSFSVCCSLLSLSRLLFLFSLCIIPLFLYYVLEIREVPSTIQACWNTAEKGASMSLNRGQSNQSGERAQWWKGGKLIGSNPEVVVI